MDQISEMKQKARSFMINTWNEKVADINHRTLDLRKGVHHTRVKDLGILLMNHNQIKFFEDVIKQGRIGDKKSVLFIPRVAKTDRETGRIYIHTMDVECITLEECTYYMIGMSIRIISEDHKSKNELLIKEVK